MKEVENSTEYFYGKNHELMMIYLNFNYHCPLKCDYCVVVSDEKVTSRYSESEVPLELVKKFIEIKQPFIVNIAGGEPTFIENLLEYLKVLDGLEYCENISVFTSLTRDASWFKGLSEANLSKVKLMLSYHFDFRDKTNFVEKIKEISKYDLNLLVEFMMGSASDEAFDDLVELSKSGVDLNIAELRGTPTFEYKLTKEDVSRFYKYVEEYQQESKDGEEWIPTLDKFKQISIKKMNNTKTFANTGKLEEHSSSPNFKGWGCHALQFSVENKQKDLVFRNVCDDALYSVDDLNKFCNSPSLIKCTQEQCTPYAMHFLKINDPTKPTTAKN